MPSQGRLPFAFKQGSYCLPSPGHEINEVDGQRGVHVAHTESDEVVQPHPLLHPLRHDAHCSLKHLQVQGGEAVLFRGRRAGEIIMASNIHWDRMKHTMLS